MGFTLRNLAMSNHIMRNRFLGVKPVAEFVAAEFGVDEMFGRAYTSSLSVLTLTPPYQILPIYQR
jgi:hypothetical protein